jgi:regulatory protein
METSLNQVLKPLQQICSKQEKCRSEILSYLVRKGIPEELHLAVLAQLIADRFIDEARYAKAAVQDKFVLNRWGKQKIRHFLETKLIPEEILERAMDTLDASDYRKMIEEELHKKMSALSGEQTGIREMKILRFAASRGYEEEMVREICAISGQENLL